MDKYFSDEEVELFIEAWLNEYPDAIERAHFIMQHPFRDLSSEMGRQQLEMNSIAQKLDYFKEALSAADGLGFHRLHSDVIDRVTSMLGPIGSYEIYE